MSDTPRADAAYSDAVDVNKSTEDCLSDMTNFARQLEREIAALNAQLYDHDKAAADEIAALKAEREVDGRDIERWRLRALDAKVQIAALKAERDAWFTLNCKHEEEIQRHTAENARLRELLRGWVKYRPCPQERENCCCLRCATHAALEEEK